MNGSPFDAMGDAQPLATLTVGELRRLLSELVLPPPQPEHEALLTLEDLARTLRCSTRHIRRLRGEGLPVVMVGEAPRFERDAVLAWLRARSGAP
jgi:excisionase family DNA binding protein